MFTGIIETTGTIYSTDKEGTNLICWVESSFSSGFKIDQSVAHNGICLTIDALKENRHRITAIEETLSKTNAGNWKKGDIVNIERCLQVNQRLDGHFVQGHIDGTGMVKDIITNEGSWEYIIEFPEQFAPLLIEKGSIALNGTSLTVFNVNRHSFSVGIIPYTYHHTNMHTLKTGDKVNLEFDMIGKYIVRQLDLKNEQQSSSF